MYEVPLVRPVHAADRPETTHEPSAGTTLAAYEVIASPPLDAGATHDRSTRPLPGVAFNEVGAPDTVRGVTDELGSLGRESPARFVATTENVYACPLVRPVHDAVSPDTRHDPSDGDAVTE